MKYFTIKSDIDAVVLKKFLKFLTLDEINSEFDKLINTHSRCTIDFYGVNFKDKITRNSHASVLRMFKFFNYSSRNQKVIFFVIDKMTKQLHLVSGDAIFFISSISRKFEVI